MGSSGTGPSGSSGGESSASLELRPERSVLESQPEALKYMSLDRVLGRMLEDVGDGTTPWDLYLSLIESFRPWDAELTLRRPHCDDETRGAETQPGELGTSALNGFAVPCPLDVSELQGFFLALWRPLAMVNRFDLAPMGGENCGEQHLNFFYEPINFGPGTRVRAYLRVAAVIENPEPERGLEGCRPIVDFWASLSRDQYDDAEFRARTLEIAFFGSASQPFNFVIAPEARALARPFISPEHFGHKGRLQWMFRGEKDDWRFFEHAFVTESEGLIARRPLTQTLPIEALLGEHAKRDGCIDALIQQSVVERLLTNDLSRVALDISPDCFAGTASSLSPRLVDGISDTPAGLQLAETFEEVLTIRHGKLPIPVPELAARMDFAGTCIGCHERPNWLTPGSITHIKEDRLEPCSTTPRDASQCYARSALLTDNLLPAWLKTLNEYRRYPGAYLSDGSPSVLTISGAPVVRGNP